MDYKILIADDEPEIRNLLRLYLENENYHVIEAEDGQRALDLLRAEQPALCILDIMMPKMDGITVLKNIRAQGKLDVLFERFYRLDSSRNSGTGGSGIGLSVAQAIVQAHRGKITAENKTGNGLTITVLL